MRRPLLGWLRLGWPSSGPAAPGRAETVRLKSGAAYEASSVEVKGERLVLRLSLGAGTGTASFPFASIHAGDLARILAARLAPDDAPGQLRIARLALEAGRYAEAFERAQRAAMLDPLLGAGSTEVLAGIRAAQAREALVEIELDLRLGHALAARERALALLEAGVPVLPPELEAAMARLLLSLAEAVLAPPMPADAPPALLEADPALPPGMAAPSSAWTDAVALQERGLAARMQAADPALAAPQREVLLSEAAVDLLDARRLLLALPTTAAPDLGARLERLRELLVATWLDLADLARGAGQPGVALDRVQAALVLDPEHPRAWELRRWIEGICRRPS
jgi:tetratricopeptide (TPR) repeat protein